MLSSAKIYACKYCGATENAQYGAFDVSWKTAQHVRNECPKNPKKQKSTTQPDRPEKPEEKKSIFRTPPTPTQIMVSVLVDWEVNEKVINRITKLAEREGEAGLHPSTLRQILIDMDSGKKAKEIAYIVDDYANGLSKAVEDDRRGGSRLYPSYRRDRDPYDDQFGRFPAPSRFGEDEFYEDRFGRRHPYPPQWAERQQGRSEDLSTLEERITQKVSSMLTKTKAEDAQDKLMEAMRQNSEDIVTIATELKSLKENPPTSPDKPLTENPYVLMLQEQLRIAREDAKNINAEMKDQRKEMNDIIIRKDQELRTLESSRHARSTEGYTEDSSRLAAEGMHEVADVLRNREPIRLIVEGARNLIGTEEKAPEREKVGGESKIISSVPQEYLE